jgi:hypothetical protein
MSDEAAMLATREKLVSAWRRRSSGISVSNQPRRENISIEENRRNQHHGSIGNGIGRRSAAHCHQAMSARMTRKAASKRRSCHASVKWRQLIMAHQAKNLALAK